MSRNRGSYPGSAAPSLASEPTETSRRATWATSGTLHPMAPTHLETLRNAIAEYATARRTMLAALDLPASNRDPLAEFSEHLVKVLVAGEFPPSRVQRSYDVIAPDGRKIQVKYLANPPEAWINEHHVVVNDEMDDYAIVFFEALLPIALVIFPARGLRPVCEALGKRHPNQERMLQLTRTHYRAIVGEPAKFAPLGVRVYREPDWVLEAYARARSAT